MELPSRAGHSRLTSRAIGGDSLCRDRNRHRKPDQVQLQKLDLPKEVIDAPMMLSAMPRTLQEQ
jgi:hypothetical protein